MRLTVLMIVVLGVFAQATPTVAPHGMVISNSKEATQVGLEILKRGGNAADTAVAISFVLAVTKPYYGSVGGGGFMLMKFKNTEVQALDYREKAPGGAKADMFLKSKASSEDGGLSVAIPGSVRGLVALHEKHGHLKWSQLLEPAIKLADSGFPVSYEWSTYIREEMSRLSPGAFKHFSRQENSRTFPKVGEILCQPGLAQALRLIQQNKARGFYEGPVAEDLMKTVAKQGGILTPQDLKSYKARWVAPVEISYRGKKIYTMPLPSTGGVLLTEFFRFATQIPLEKTTPMSSEEYHLIAEIMNRGAEDRSLLGDPQFSQIPLQKILDPARLDRIAREIKSTHNPSSDQNKVTSKGAHEGENTTHFVIVDQEGQTVSATTTLNGLFGSGVVTEKYGINLNNEMDDFNTRPGKPNMFGLVQGAANEIAPFKTPLSSMTPALVFDEKGELELSLGSPGGPKIVSAVFQTIYRSLNSDWNLERVISAPRVHHQHIPDQLNYDENAFSPDVLKNLEKLGHKLKAVEHVGRVFAIRRMKNRLLESAPDYREESFAAGF